MGIKTPSLYVRVCLHLKLNRSPSFTDAGENPVLSLVSHAHRIPLRALNLFTYNLKHFVCIAEYCNTTNAQCRHCMKVSMQIFPSSVNIGTYMYQAFSQDSPFYVQFLKAPTVLEKKKRFLFII